MPALRQNRGRGCASENLDGIIGKEETLFLEGYRRHPWRWAPVEVERMKRSAIPPVVWFLTILWAATWSIPQTGQSVPEVEGGN